MREWQEWRPASGHRSGWRVVRLREAPVKYGASMQEANGPSGKLRLFKSYETALHAAQKLNAVYP